jgi:hypothetical protein
MSDGSSAVDVVGLFGGEMERERGGEGVPQMSEKSSVGYGATVAMAVALVPGFGIEHEEGGRL